MYIYSVYVHVLVNELLFVDIHVQCLHVHVLVNELLFVDAHIQCLHVHVHVFLPQSYVNSQSGSHYGTLPRSGKDGEERGKVGGRDLPDEIRPHSGSLSVYHDRRVSSPVYPDRVMRTHSSENTPVRYMYVSALLGYL